MFQGCYIEDLVYGNSICAEDQAIFQAISEEQKDFKALVVYYEDAEGNAIFSLPNGKWRQKFYEFGNFLLISCKSAQNFIVKTTSSLLPFSYVPITQSRALFEPDPNSLTEVTNAAAYWLQIDFNHETRKDVEVALASDDIEALKSKFCNRIQFGTAGLRGRMCAGYNFMNYVTVQQTTQGICKYLIEQELDLKKGMVIGYDGRYNSYGYAQIVAATCKHFGVRVYRFDRRVPTPLVPFFLTKFKCLMGVMITASHNPKEDNGYKVYWSNGAQIIPPHDKNIQTHIEDNLNLIDLSDYVDYHQFKLKFNPDNFSSAMINQYVSEMTKQYSINEREINKKCPQIVYTAMHGVGYSVFLRALSSLSFSLKAVEK